MHFYDKKIKFLGFEFDSSEICTKIPIKRLEMFKNMRSPRSQTECISRLGMLSYFNEYLTNLKKIIAPLLKLSTADIFYWTRLEEEVFSNTKMLCALEIENNLIDPEKTLFITWDSLQILYVFMNFQLSSEGFIKVIKSLSLKKLYAIILPK